MNTASANSSPTPAKSPLPTDSAHLAIKSGTAVVPTAAFMGPGGRGPRDNPLAPRFGRPLR